MGTREVRKILYWVLGVAVAAAATAIGACNRNPVTEPKVKDEPAAAFRLTSPAFEDGQRMPKKYTGDGADLSPPLAWTDPSEGTKAFALLCDDLDAPRGPWNHWVIWNLPADLRKLSEGIPKQKTLPDLGGARQGNNSWPRIGYGGPTPPRGTGTHRYVFTLYALDTALDLEAGANKAALLAKMGGHVQDKTTLTGTFSR